MVSGFTKFPPEHLYASINIASINTEVNLVFRYTSYTVISEFDL